MGKNDDVSRISDANQRFCGLRRRMEKAEVFSVSASTLHRRFGLSFFVSTPFFAPHCFLVSVQIDRKHKQYLRIPNCFRRPRNALVVPSGPLHCPTSRRNNWQTKKRKNGICHSRARGGDGAGAGGASERLRVRILLEQIRRGPLGGPALHLLRGSHCLGPRAVRSVCRGLRGVLRAGFRRAFFLFAFFFFSCSVPLGLIRVKALQSRLQLARARLAC